MRFGRFFSDKTKKAPPKPSEIGTKQVSDFKGLSLVSPVGSDWLTFSGVKSDHLDDQKVTWKKLVIYSIKSKRFMNMVTGTVGNWLVSFKIQSPFYLRWKSQDKSMLKMHPRWFKVTFWSPSWRSLNPLKGSLNHPKKVTLNHQVRLFSHIFSKQKTHHH